MHFTFLFALISIASGVPTLVSSAPKFKACHSSSSQESRMLRICPSVTFARRIPAVGNVVGGKASVVEEAKQECENYLTELITEKSVLKEDELNSLMRELYEYAVAMVNESFEQDQNTIKMVLEIMQLYSPYNPHRHYKHEINSLIINKMLKRGDSFDNIIKFGKSIVEQAMNPSDVAFAINPFLAALVSKIKEWEQSGERKQITSLLDSLISNKIYLSVNRNFHSFYVTHFWTVRFNNKVIVYEKVGDGILADTPQSIQLFFEQNKEYLEKLESNECMKERIEFGIRYFCHAVKSVCDRLFETSGVCLDEESQEV